MDNPKTKELASNLSKFGSGSFFIIDGQEVDRNLKLSVSSLVGANAVPAIGANVYDIIKNNKVLITKDALVMLEERLR